MSVVRKYRTISFSEKKRWSASDWRKLKRRGRRGEKGEKGGGRRIRRKIKGKRREEREEFEKRKDRARVECPLHFHCHAR